MLNNLIREYDETDLKERASGRPASLFANIQYENTEVVLSLNKATNRKIFSGLRLRY